MWPLPWKKGLLLRNTRRLLRALLLGVAVVGIVAPASVVYAAPSASDIQQQINQKSTDLEKVVEQYNKVSEQLKATQAAQVALQAQLQPLQAKMDAAYANVSDLAAAAYKGSALGTVNAMLTAGSPQTLVDRLDSLDQIGRGQHAQIVGYERAKAQYAAQQKQISDNLASQSSQQSYLAGQKTKIQGDLNNLYTMRTKAYGTPTETPKKSTVSAPYVAGKAGIAVKFAYAAIGTPYVWAGASSGGYDCSGLTMAAWAAAGVSLPHNAAEQWGVVSHISRGALQPGDLVFYLGLGHVAIYVGNNQVIHAPQAGEDVKLASVDMLTPYGYGRPKS
jgi:cell wall-associated NlpC family hydrolase